MLLINMFRNLMKNKVQFFSIFMMSFLGLFTFVGLDSEVTGFTFAEGNYYTQQNLGDLYLFDRNFSADDEKMIENLPEVNSASRRIKVSGKAVLPENNKDADMEINFIEEDEISKLLIKEGTPYSSGDGGVWLDYIFAEKNNIKIGDTVSLKYEDSTWSEIVRGTVMHPEHLYFLQDVAQMMPSYGTYGFCYMDVKENPDPEMITFSEMAVDLKEIDNLNPLTDEEKDHISRIGEKISDILDRDTLAFYDKNGLLSYQTFRSEMDQHKAMSFMFPVVFILISMLGIITTMTRLTARQRVQIGTLKALGLSKRVITLHYVSYGFFLSLAGSLAGAAAGYKYIVDMIVDMMKQTYLLPNAGGRLSYNSIFIIIAEVVIASLVSYLSCRRELSLPPAETLRPASPKNLNPSAFEKSALWNSFSFSTQWNLRDIKRNKARTGMGIIGVAGCTMLMLAAFGCLDSINFITDWMYGELNTCSYQIIMESFVPYSDVYDYAKKYKGQMMENESADFRFNGIKKTGTVSIIDNGNYMHFQDEDYSHTELTQSGIAMSYKMAQSLGMRKGDFVTWNLTGDDEVHTDRIVQIYRNPGTQGITMRRKVYEKHEYKFKPTIIMTNMDPSLDLKEDNNVTGVQNTSEMMESMDKMKEMMYMMMGILISAAVILGVVVLYNLGVLSFVEKTKEMATLKVLGFKSRKIRGILGQQNLWVTISGTLLGIPLGILLLDGIMSDMPESMDYQGIIYAPSYFYSVIGTFALSIAVSLFLSRKVNTIDMVDALKGQE